MARPLPYSTVESFYNVLVAYQNEDGYVVCTALYAGKVAGISLGNVKILVKRLDKMGVLRLYTASPERQELRASEFMIIKIIAPLTKEKYVEHFLGEFDRQHEEARQIRLAKLMSP